MDEVKPRETGRVKSNGIELAFEAFGDPEGSAVILTMGLGVPAVGWPLPLIGGLTDAGFQVIRFDNRDVGRSTILSERGAPKIAKVMLRAWLRFPQNVPYSLMDMAYDVVGLMDSLGIEAAHHVGVSMGGMIAQHLVGRFPWRALSLTSMMSSSGRPGLPGAKREVVRVLTQSPPRGASREEVIRHGIEVWRTIGSTAFPRKEDDLRRFVVACIKRGQSPSGFRRQHAAIIADGSRVALLACISRPTLVIHGENDPLVPVACGIDTARHIEGAHLEVIPGMGHDIPEALLPRITSLIVAHVSAADASRDRDRPSHEPSS